MLSQLCKKLQYAEGRSEFVISVICDIRGFSRFSTYHESPDTAMFIKRFYLKLLEEYFTKAIFAKPTGDGLLLIFRYSENNLAEVSENVLSACFKVTKDFPSMFKDDPMINFPTPSRVGFGISRGPSCCLFSARTIIDYSGQLLNLATRLNDLARPQGIVIAGNFLYNVIPTALRDRFKSAQVYVRGIAEEEPINVFFSTDVILPAYSLQPITIQDWKFIDHSMTVAELNKLSGNFVINLPSQPVSNDKTRLTMAYKNPATRGYIESMDLSEFEVTKDSSGYQVKFNLVEAQNIVTRVGLTRNKTITFRFQFVPKPASKRNTKTRKQKKT